jgi:hypothetical protein
MLELERFEEASAKSASELIARKAKPTDVGAGD